MEDFSPSKNDGILRHIIEHGEGTDNPKEGAVVTVELEGRILPDGKVFDNRTITFPLGEGIDSFVCEGIELALEKFLLKEKSQLLIQPEHAFKSDGHKDLGVPPNATVDYIVKLTSFEKSKDDSMDSTEKIQQGKLYKEKGTKYFKDDKYELAIKMYKRVATFVHDISENNNEPKKVRKEAQDLLSTSYSNLALVYLKMTPVNYLEVMEYASKALRIDAKNIKALYRRGQASLGLGKATKALQDFKKVIEAEPGNKAAANQIVICKQTIRKQTKNKKKAKKAQIDDNFADQDDNSSEHDDNSPHQDDNSPELDDNSHELDDNSPELDANSPELDDNSANQNDNPAVQHDNYSANLDDKKFIDVSAAADYVDKYIRQFYKKAPMNEQWPRNTDFKKLSPQEHQEKRNKLKLVAKKIIENSSLFAQLEHSYKKIKMEEVKLYDINFMVNRFLHPKAGCSKKNYAVINYFDEMALAALGHFADYLYSGIRVSIIVNGNMTACVHLFVKLCHEAGFTENNIRFLYEEHPFYDIMYGTFDVQRIENADYTRGCIFVVTDKTDLYAVVNSILNATDNYRYPWHLRRVIVKKSVYDQFDQVLFKNTTKCRDKVLYKKFNKYCSKIAEFRQKVIIKDFKGDSNKIKMKLEMKDPFVLIDSYETTEELLSLLNSKYQPRYISIWCDEIKEANKIALHSKAGNVWINEFGNFNATNFLTYYDNYEYQEYQEINDNLRNKIEKDEKIVIDNMVKVVTEKRKKWIKFTEKEREEFISKLLKKVLKRTHENDIDTDNFAYTDDQIVCYGVKKPYEIVVIAICGDLADEHLDLIIEYLTKGSAVILVNESSMTECPNVIQTLAQNDIPVAHGHMSQRAFFDNKAIDFYASIFRLNRYTGSPKIVLTRYTCNHHSIFD